MFKLRELLLWLSEYDEIFLDTPPAWDFYTRSAFIASERRLIPFDCDAFLRQVLYTLLQQGLRNQLGSQSAARGGWDCG